MAKTFDNIKKFLGRFARKENGQALLEYALIFGLVGVFGIAMYYYFYQRLEIYNQLITHYISLPIP